MNDNAAQHSTDAASSHVPEARDRRVSLLVGDRFCIACGFNLVGQSVVREPHYNMLMVRCPECGTAAAMQEYPLLGRWASRWARVLAVAMMLLMTVLTFGASLACWGVSIPPVLAMVEPLAEKLGESQIKWKRAQAIAAPQNAAVASPFDSAPATPAPESLSAEANTIPVDTSLPVSSGGRVRPSAPANDSGAAVSPNPAVAMNSAEVSSPPAVAALEIVIDEDQLRRYGESDWAQSGEPKAVLAKTSIWEAGINWAGLKWLVLSLPVAFLFGVIFSVLLLGLGRWKALVIIPIVFGLSTCWAYIDKLDDSSQWGGQIDWMAADLAGFPLHVVVFLFMAYAMSMGIWSRRAIARGFVRVMLPPRLCGSLADLWLSDGKTPPYAAQSRTRG